MADLTPITDADMAPPPLTTVSDDDMAPAPVMPAGPHAPQVPQAVYQRLQNGDAITNIVNKTMEGMKAGSTGAGSTDEEWARDAQAVQKAGLLAGDVPIVGGVLRPFARAAVADVSLAGEALKRIYGGFLGGVKGAVQGMGEAVGAPNAEEAGNSAAGWLDAELAKGGPGIHMTTPVLTAAGTMRDALIGPLPRDAADVTQQSATVANALHLPEAAPTVAALYNERGITPAEVLNDAKTNPAVMRHLAGGENPYPTSDWTGQAVEPPKEGPGEPKPAPATETPVPPPTGGVPAAPLEPGVSKIGKSIEAKAVEAGLTEGFKDTAHYDPVTVKDQAAQATQLVNGDLDKARAIVRGEQPLPGTLKGVSLVTAMEEHIKANPNGDLAEELANSPLVSATSAAAQELRLAAERTPDSATAALQQVKDAAVAKAGGPVEIAARKAVVKAALPEASGILLPKELLSWDKFLDGIKC